MIEEFFFCQKSYGKNTRMKFFSTSKKIPPTIHRQAKQELEIKVAQNWFEGTLYQSASHHNFFFVEIKTPMGVEQWFEVQFQAVFSTSRE